MLAITGLEKRRKKITNIVPEEVGVITGRSQKIQENCIKLRFITILQGKIVQKTNFLKFSYLIDLR